ncbi:MAG: desulfoferrodoxin [Elusimicrobiaceae bacterium]|nr:desulfoferrodoxin [Elusimicrobiaceae bacterium]
MELNELYRCGVCGNIVQVTHVGGGQLVCCGKPMDLLAENTVEAAHEKHIPVLEKIETGFIVRVGEVAHPMEEKHFIEWIELRGGGRVYRKQLKPGDKPEAVFSFRADGDAGIEARAYCNIHGYWQGGFNNDRQKN